MTPANSRTIRMSRIFQERFSSLLEDGYKVRVTYMKPDLWLVKLKHMANGNSITLKARVHDYTIIQTTNNIEVYREEF